MEGFLIQGYFKGQSARLRVGMSSLSSISAIKHDEVFQVMNEESRSPAVISSSPQHETTH